MSNFAGVTFAEQLITPSDDGIVHRAIFSDGILSGCAFSYSGATLTMAAGSLMICGRQIRHTAPSSWTAAGATSGFARVVLTIDLSQTSTETEFTQVSAEIQYATAQDGFSSLVTSDINAGGIKYQAVLCVVSLGAGGITGVVSALPQCSANARANLAFASAGSAGTLLPLPRGEQVKIDLSQWKTRSSNDFTFANGGIVLPWDGDVLVFGSVYFEDISEATPANVGPYVHLNGAEAAGHLTYSQSVSAVHMAPVILSVKTGDVLTLHGRNVTRDGACLPSAKMTRLSVTYLSGGTVSRPGESPPGNEPSGGGGSGETPPSDGSTKCTGITLDQSLAYLTGTEGNRNPQLTLTATVTPEGCTDPVTWYCLKKHVATVDNGVVTAVGDGTCRIVALCGEYSAGCTVIVSGVSEDVPCTGLVLSRTKLDLKYGESYTLTATVEPDNCTFPVEWSVDNELVASINTTTAPGVNGNQCVVLGRTRQLQVATITATCGDQTAQCKVSVSESGNQIM